MSNTVNLAQKFATSDKFKNLFREGMALVEESAAYLDGCGREDAKGLPRNTAMLYGSESMKLTTRLMQLASWLLLQRAANEGEMTREQVLEEKQKIKLDEIRPQSETTAWQELPKGFTGLVNRSVGLQKRVINLDTELYGGPRNTPVQHIANPVGQQIDLLSTALGTAKN